MISVTVLLENHKNMINKVDKWNASKPVLFVTLTTSSIIYNLGQNGSVKVH